ncbi:MAG: glycoside hydrolase family 97 catalytic domain-containing protein [Anaerohalosphaera sp.]|nr:glycoside hydrolase family 97 catalytic domain-containing protein [Anaerohalosphaera sp.]
MRNVSRFVCNNLFWVGIFLVAASSTIAQPGQCELNSPDGRIAAAVYVKDGMAFYTVTFNGVRVIKESALGLVLDQMDGPKWGIKYTQPSKHDSTWQPVWSKQAAIRDHYNEMKLCLADENPSKLKMYITFRAYNDGVAFRYSISVNGDGDRELKVVGDLTDFSFGGDYTAWFYNGERANIGPQLLSQSKGTFRWPMTVKVSDKCYMAINEAAIYDFSWMELTSEKGTTKFSAKIRPSKVKMPFETPWRVIMLAGSPGSLVDSHLLENLNPPCKIEDTSWIKPGVSFWDWRAWGHVADDFTYALSMDSWKRFVDLAAQSKVSYLLLDADWYGPEFDSGSDPATTEKDVPGLVKYAKQNGVGVFLYLNDVGAKKYGLENILKTFSQWGAVGVKYGFMREPAGQPKVNRTQMIIELCAENKLMCIFHDNPVPPSGDMRTWPNCVTREFCHSQSDAKSVFVPRTFVTAVYVNMLAGPLDMCNGLFDLENSFEQRPKIFAEVPSTIVAETARTLITFSGLTVIPDSADSYKKHPELFDFIASQKMPWQQSKTLAGEIGEYIVMTRRNGDAVFIASATNENARTIKLPLDFLAAGTYQATMLEDADDTHYLTNRQAYKVRSVIVRSGDIIEIKMAPGGGHCIKLTPVTK